MAFFKTKKEKTGQVNCPEVFNLWDMVSAKYQYLEKLQVWSNFAHDPDLLYFIDRTSNLLQKYVNILEKKLREFSIKGPDAGIKSVNTEANSEIITDKLIAQDTLVWVQGATELFIYSMRVTTTNDELRGIFMNVAKDDIKLLDDLIDYLSIKGWLGVPPLYPHIPPENQEKLNTAEAFHLWDHLTFRYDNIYQTEVHKETTSDSDLKLLITTGLQQVLRKQATRLEKECNDFGIPLPSRPPNIVAFPPNFFAHFRDEFIYRQLSFGIVGATQLHAVAVKQCVTNQRIRKLFVELLGSELDILDKFIKLGKLKGYIHPVPEYSLK